MGLRNEIIDIAKGLGIILMVIGHTPCPKYLHDFIYLFHMPLFFLLSGYCFNPKYLSDARVFLVRKIKAFYIPYIMWALLFLFLYNICFDLYIYSEKVSYYGVVFHPYTLEEIGEHALSILVSMTGHAPLLGAFWFMHSILWGNIVFFFLLRAMKITRVVAILLGVSILFLYFKIEIPIIRFNYLDAIAALFIAMGYYVREGEYKIFQNQNIGALLFLCLLLLAYFLPMSIQTVTMKKLAFFMAAGVLGSVLVMKITKHISCFPKFSSVMSYVGMHTLIILALHILCFKVCSYVICYRYDLPLWLVGEHPTISKIHRGGEFWIMYSICGVVLPLLILQLYQQLVKVIKNKIKDYGTSIRL